MVPSADHILELVELFLVEREGAGWPSQHALEAIRSQGMVAVGSGAAPLRETRRSRGSAVLLADHSRAGKVAERMLLTIESINPRLRRALELRASCPNLDHVGLRLGVDRRKAAVLVDQAVVAAQVFLVTR
jgi:hypothetical protein